MANPNTFINTYTQNIVQLCQLMQTLRAQNDQLTQDPNLVKDYFTVDANGVNSTGGRPRKDIVEADVNNAQAALVQMLFTFDSGSPTQKSYLFKMLP